MIEHVCTRRCGIRPQTAFKFTPAILVAIAFSCSLSNDTASVPEPPKKCDPVNVPPPTDHTATSSRGNNDKQTKAASMPLRQKQEPTTTYGDAGVRGAGYEFAKMLIKPTLNAPQSASFPWETVSYENMEPLSDMSGDRAERWRVSGFVDAQNSFGALLRSRWEIILLGVGDKFIPAEARLGGEVVFQLSTYGAMFPVPKARLDGLVPPVPTSQSPGYGDSSKPLTLRNHMSFEDVKKQVGKESFRHSSAKSPGGKEKSVHYWELNDGRVLVCTFWDDSLESWSFD